MNELELLRNKVEIITRENEGRDDKIRYIADHTNGLVYALEVNSSAKLRLITIYTLVGEEYQVQEREMAANEIVQLNKGCRYGKYVLNVLDNIPVLAFTFNIWCEQEVQQEDMDEMNGLALSCLLLAKNCLELIVRGH